MVSAPVFGTDDLNFTFSRCHLMIFLVYLYMFRCLLYQTEFYPIITVLQKKKKSPVLRAIPIDSGS